MQRCKIQNKWQAKKCIKLSLHSMQKNTWNIWSLYKHKRKRPRFERHEPEESVRARLNWSGTRRNKEEPRGGQPKTIQKGKAEAIEIEEHHEGASPEQYRRARPKP